MTGSLLKRAWPGRGAGLAIFISAHHTPARHAWQVLARWVWGDGGVHPASRGSGPPSQAGCRPGAQSHTVQTVSC